MISKDSKSYPYLAIAQHYGISYTEVLSYADNRKPPFTGWQLEVWKLEFNKRCTKESNKIT